MSLQNGGWLFEITEEGESLHKNVLLWFKVKQNWMTHAVVIIFEKISEKYANITIV